jgi:hypothetical protein
MGLESGYLKCILQVKNNAEELHLAERQVLKITFVILY